MENTKKAKETSDIVILVNGPGELSSYVKPTVAALNKMPADKRIIIVFTPCPYSTGKEVGIASGIPGVNKVISHEEFIRWALFRARPKDIQFNRKGVVLYMGGDILYGKIIAKKLGYPALAYSEAYAKWPKIYRRFLVPDRMIYDKFKAQGFPEEQIKIVGNLMVDSIKADKSRDQVLGELGFDPKKKIIAFMPGSREFQVSYTFSFFSQVAGNVRAMDSSIQFAFIISPYLPENIFNKYVSNIDPAITIIRSGQQNAIKASDLVITTPGTNTAEIAILGTPMISVFPYANPHMIPLEGIYNILGKIPFLGFILKKHYVKIALFKTRFFAIPNIKTGSEIVPELKGSIKPGTLAEKAVSLLKDPARLNEMSSLLKTSLNGPGAAGRIAEEINEIIS